LLEERSLIIDKTKRIQTKITLTKYNDSSKDSALCAPLAR
jgi:hypothetical protein